MRTRVQLLLLGVLLATGLAACSSDAVVEATAATDEVAAGLEALRVASARHALAESQVRTAEAHKAWRQATADRARNDRLAETDHFRAEAKVAGERLRAAQAEEATEQLRAQAKVNGETLRRPATVGSELADKQAIQSARTALAAARLAAIEQLRAEARVAGDQLRLQADTVVVWTEAGPVTVDRQGWADQLATLVAGAPATNGVDVVQTATSRCDQPRVVALVTHNATLEAGHCPASDGLWIPPTPRVVITSISIEHAEPIP